MYRNGCYDGKHEQGNSTLMVVCSDFDSFERIKLPTYIILYASRVSRDHLGTAKNDI